MRDAHGSLDVLDIFTTVLSDGAVNGGATVEIFDTGNAKGDPGKYGKTMVLGRLQKTSRRTKGNRRMNLTASKSKSSPRCQISNVSRIHDGFNMGIFRSTAH